jgi:hypothetical protein
MVALNHASGIENTVLNCIKFRYRYLSTEPSVDDAQGMSRTVSVFFDIIT